MNKLTLDDITKYRNAELILSRLEQPIIERIDYIIKTIHEVFDAKYDHWYFDGAQEGEVGPIPDLTFSSMHSIRLIHSKLPISTNILLKNGEEWGLNWCSFPTRWLYENFEEELIKGKILYKEKLVKRAEETKKKKEEDKVKKAELIKSAKSKLSKAEIAALKGS